MSTDLYEIAAVKLRELRINHNMTIKDMGAVLEIDPPSRYANIENGKEKPTLPQILAASMKFTLPYTYFFPPGSKEIAKLKELSPKGVRFIGNP